MSTRPKVTIGIPTRNRRDYLRAALSSVFCQTYTNLEVVVSDNCSSDGTFEDLSEYPDHRLRFVRQSTDLGMVQNFNAVLNLATGEYFLLLSDDDLLEPTAIETLMRPFEDPPQNKTPADIGVVWCACKIIDSDGGLKWKTQPGPFIESPVEFVCEFVKGNRGPRLSGVLLRTADAVKLGGYDEQFGPICDIGLWFQIALHYAAIICVPEMPVFYRVHSASGTGEARLEQWCEWGRRTHAAFTSCLIRQGNITGANRLRRMLKPFLANITADIMIRDIGKPGWHSRAMKEIWRSRNYLVTPHTFRRVIRDGIKLLA
jgi:hypothetical protein